MAALKELKDDNTLPFLNFTLDTISQPLVRAAAEHAGKSEVSRFNHLDMVQDAIKRVNKLVVQPNSDSDLIAISILQKRISENNLPQLPELFSWSDRKEKLDWTRTLRDTLGTIDDEINQNYYRNPAEIDNGNPEDVAKFFLLDGYARWYSITFGNTGSQDEERNLANVVVNACCEAAVVDAEQGNIESIALVAWMQKHSWFKLEYGFSNNLIARAQQVVLDSPETLKIIPLDSEMGSDEERPQDIRTLVVHSMWAKGKRKRFSVEECKALLDKEEVSAHYIIDREGNIYQLVNGKRMAWHAGTSQMPPPDSEPKVNFFSLGIELIGDKKVGFTEAQYKSLALLSAHLMQKYEISGIVGHGDIAPKRKTDPWNLNWLKYKHYLEAHTSLGKITTGRLRT